MATEQSEVVKVKRVEVWLYKSSEPLVFEALNTYTKGPLFCIYSADQKVVKFPIVHIFRIVEDYHTLPIGADSQPEQCLWSEFSDPDYWETSCGQTFTIIEGTPKDNDMRFCPYCGKPLLVRKDLPDCWPALVFPN